MYHTTQHGYRRQSKLLSSAVHLHVPPAASTMTATDLRCASLHCTQCLANASVPEVKIQAAFLLCHFISVWGFAATVCNACTAQHSMRTSGQSNKCSSAVHPHVPLATPLVTATDLGGAILQSTHHLSGANVPVMLRQARLRLCSVSVCPCCDACTQHSMVTSGRATNIAQLSILMCHWQHP